MHSQSCKWAHEDASTEDADTISVVSRVDFGGKFVENMINFRAKAQLQKTKKTVSFSPLINNMEIRSRSK